MEERLRKFDSLMKQEFISVQVRDPQVQRGGLWHTHIDYEICLHTNSMCFQRKTSCVRRRYSEFVWLRQKLQFNAVLMELPKLPPWNPFFSLRKPLQLKQRTEGLQDFLEIVLQTPLLLSDSCLHLFLQSELSVSKMEACSSGRTRYSVAQAIQRAGRKTRPSPSDESDTESTTSSAGLDYSIEDASRPPPESLDYSSEEGSRPPPEGLDYSSEEGSRPPPRAPVNTPGSQDSVCCSPAAHSGAGDL